MLTAKNYFCRLIGLVMTVLLIGILVEPVAPANAQGETQLRVTPQTGDVAPGKAITVAVEVSDGSNLNAYDLTVVYDEEVLTLETWEHGDYLSNLAVVKRVETPGSFRLVVTQLATAGVSGDGELLRLVFRAGSSGSTQVSIVEAKLATSDNEMVFPGLVTGTITVTAAEEPTFTATQTQTTAPGFAKTPIRTNTPQPATMTKTPTPVISRTSTTAPVITSPLTGSATPAAALPGGTTSIGQVGQALSTSPVTPEESGSLSEKSTSRPGGTAAPVQPDGETVSKTNLNTLLWGLVAFLLAAFGAMLVIYIRRDNRK